MLDLQPIKVRLDVVTSWTGSGDSEFMHRLAAWDIAALVAEVERLRQRAEMAEAEAEHWRREGGAAGAEYVEGKPMTDLDLARQDVAETMEAYAGAMRVIRWAAQMLVEGKPKRAQSLLLQALAAHDNEVAWSDVGGDSDSRLAATTPGPWYREVTGVAHRGIRTKKAWLFADDGATEADAKLVANAPADLAALVAEVEQLRGELDDNEAEIRRLRDAIVEHRKGLLRSGHVAGLDVTEFDRNLWAVLDA